LSVMASLWSIFMRRFADHIIGHGFTTEARVL